MKVIGAGFGRTGTLSLKTALEKLGFGPCYHMVEVMAHPEHAAFWAGAADRSAEGQPVNWEEVFTGYEATVDWPGCVFYEELMQSYPEAKVLLSVRDPEKWYESVRNTFLRGMGDSSLMRTLMFEVLPVAVPSMRPVYAMIRKVIFERTLKGHSWEDKEQAIKAFERHVEEVKERVPADKLLVYEVTQGWEPLCAFLEVDTPDEPFPRRNDSQEFRKMMRRQMLSSLAPAAGKAAAILSILLLATLLFRYAPLRGSGPR